VRRIDHLRFFVGNARQSAYFYRNAFGFEVLAYAGLETGLRQEAAYLLRQGQITFVLASPLGLEHPRAAVSSSTATACRTSP
jgi:4-hydroxyphenylpyruvate dioxygenase